VALQMLVVHGCRRPVVVVVAVRSGYGVHGQGTRSVVSEAAVPPSHPPRSLDARWGEVVAGVRGARHVVFGPAGPQAWSPPLSGAPGPAAACPSESAHKVQGAHRVACSHAPRSWCCKVWSYRYKNTVSTVTD